MEKTFKKKSIFFKLPYWETLLVRHNLDIMHIEKNVFDNIVGTCLDVDKQSKDGLNARLDLKEMNIRAELHADTSGPKPIIHVAIYQMNKQGKMNFCMVIKHARFPDGYASNFFHKVQLDKKILVGMKTHDYHIIMQDLMPLALCRSLPESVDVPLIGLCKYFKMMYGKVVDIQVVEEWECKIVEILCQLEMIFPPSFFDIMVHLTMHLATELRKAGPVAYRDMWATERMIGHLKNSVQTTSHPEGSIAENYQFEESLNFCSRYLLDTSSNINKAARHDDNPDPSVDGTKYLRIIGRPLSAFSAIQLDLTTWEQAQRCVLVNYPKIEHYAQ